MAMEVSILIQALEDGNFDEVDRYSTEMEAEYLRQEQAHNDAEEQKEIVEAQQEISGWICDHSKEDQQPPSAINPITAALYHKPDSDTNKHPYVQRSNEGGNFCGHHPLKPSFVMTSNPYETESQTDDLGHKRHSSILYDIVARIRGYYHQPESMPAFNRAMSDLIHSGVLFSHQRRELLDKETKTYRFHVAARAFSQAFFEALGINMQRFAKTRQWKAEHGMHPIETQKANGNQKLLLNAINHHLGAAISKAYGKKDQTTADKIKKEQARRTEIMCQLLTISGLKENPKALKAALKQRLSEEGLTPTPLPAVLSSG
jgi:hypothetical protein